MPLATFSGICMEVSNHENEEEVAITNITTAELTAAFIMIARKSLILISRKINIPTMSAYTVATAAASVGVKMPP